MILEELKNGDLLFMSDISEMSQAIQKSTGNFSHVGIYFDKMIFHATKKLGVVKQNLKDFLSEKERYICVYRYPKIDVQSVKSEAEKYLGLPYNQSFYPGEKSFYCSQYVAQILPIFETVKMKFGDGKNEISDYWKNYFFELGVPVPVGEEGTNPTGLSKSKKLIFVGELDYKSVN